MNPRPGARRWRPSIDGSQKIVKWDIKEDRLLDVIKIPDEVSSYTASFLNDICKGRIRSTMLEGMGVGYCDPADTGMHRFVADERMIWVDAPQLDNNGYIMFNHNQLHFLHTGELDYDRAGNLCVWRADVGEDVKSYLAGSG